MIYVNICVYRETDKETETEKERERERTETIKIKRWIFGKIQRNTHRSLVINAKRKSEKEK